MQNIASTQNPGARYFNKRLLKSLEVIGQRPFTLVKAPMGYGKTVAVLEFARTRLAADGRALWVPVLGGSEDVFWRDFCKVFGEAFPHEADTTQALEGLGYPYDSMRVDAACELIRRVNFPAQTLLIIDNYQFMPGRGFVRLCESLARAGQSNLHIVLITRNEYPGNKELLSLKDLLGHVGREAFALTRAEIMDYYACCGIGLSHEEAAALYAHTSGCISALYLYLLRYIKHGVLENPEGLQDLMEQEVYAPLSSAAKSFLFSLYPAERFSLEQAVFLDTSEDTEDLLQELLQKNSFVLYDPATRTYALQSILRAFLKERFEALPISQQRAFNRRSGDWFMGRGEITAAIAAYYAAGDYEKCLCILEADMTNNMVTENAHLFVRFFKTCPDEILDRHVAAGFKYALAAYISGDEATFDCCLAWLTEKCASMPADDPASLAWRGELHMLRALESYNDIEAMSEHFRAAHELLKGPTRLYGEQAAWSMGSPSVLFMFYRRSGGLAEALGQVREAMPHYYNLAYYHGAGCDLAMEGEMLYSRGDFAAAEILCHKARLEAARHDQLGTLFCSMFLHMRLALLRGAWREAEEMFAEMRGMITQGRDYYLLQTVDLCRGAMYGHLGRLEDMPEWLRLEDNPQGSLYIFAGGYYYLIHGRALLLAGENAKVVAIFDGLLEDKALAKYRLFEVYACIYIAVAYRRMGNEPAARAALRQALKTALPDQMYMPFVENSDLLGVLLHTDPCRAGDDDYAGGLKRIAELSAVWQAALDDIRSQYFPAES